MTPIHEKAAKGYQTAGDAYDRGRPEYPIDAVRYLLERLPGPVVELGAGTGKFTKVLVQCGATVTAVEPVEAMRAKFSSLLALPIVAGSAESIPFPDQSVNTVVAAQAFHWFDGPRALAEIHRVLKPGGHLGLIWNARDESIDWVAKMATIVDQYESGVPRYKTGEWRRAFDTTKLFSPLQYREFGYVQSGDVAMVLDRVASISFIAALAPAEREKVLQDVAALLAGKTRVDLPYRTDVFWCQRAS